MSAPAASPATVLRAVTRTTFATTWLSPVPWVAGVVLHVAAGLLVVDTMQARREASFTPVVPVLGFLVLLVVPVLAMRTVAEERRRGTLDLLLAVPVPVVPLVVGKWLATWCTALVLLAPVGLHVALLGWWGDPDPGPIVAGTVGLVLVAAAVAAIGVAASTATRSQAVAALAALAVVLVSWFLRPSEGSVALRTATARLSLNERLRGFAAGGVDLGDVTALLAVTLVALLGAAAGVAVLGARRDGRRTAVALVALALVVGVVQWNLDDRRRLLDLTAEDSLTLTDETLDVLAALDVDVEITAFLRPDAPGRSEAAAVLDRYEDAEPRIRAAVVDPDAAPGEVSRLGVDPLVGGVALEAGDRIELVPAAIEQDLTLGLARLARGDLPTVCLSAGHGELDPEDRDPTGWSRAAGILSGNGYDLRVVDLLTASAVPDRCRVLLVVGPAAGLGGAVDLLVEHLDGGGRLGVLLEPGFDGDLTDLLADEGIEVLGGLVAEGDPGSVFSGDATAPVVRRYGSGSPVVRNLPPTFFVTVGGLDVLGPVDDPDGRVVARLADTSEASLLVLDPDAADSDVVPGPITVVAQSETAAVRDGVPSRRRVLVAADVDWSSNAFVEEAGNAALLVQGVDWLAVDDDLVSVVTNLAAPRPLALTDARRDYARLLLAGLVPAGFALAGAATWVLRRRL